MHYGNEESQCCYGFLFLWSSSQSHSCCYIVRRARDRGRKIPNAQFFQCNRIACSLFTHKINEIIKNHKVFVYYTANYIVRTYQNHHRQKNCMRERKRSSGIRCIWCIRFELNLLLLIFGCTIFLMIRQKRHIFTFFVRRDMCSIGSCKMHVQTESIRVTA